MKGCGVWTMGNSLQAALRYLLTGAVKAAGIKSYLLVKADPCRIGLYDLTMPALPAR